MYCEGCDAKADATIVSKFTLTGSKVKYRISWTICVFFFQVCEMKHHPEVLMLLLKRFEFNYFYMSYVKMGCSVTIPRTLQIPKVDAPPVFIFQNHRCVFHS